MFSFSWAPDEKVKTYLWTSLRYWTLVHTRPKQLLRFVSWKAWLSNNWNYALSHLLTHVRNVLNLLGDVSWPIQEIYWAPWDPPTFQRSISAIGRVTGIDNVTCLRILISVSHLVIWHLGWKTYCQLAALLPKKNPKNCHKTYNVPHHQHHRHPWVGKTGVSRFQLSSAVETHWNFFHQSEIKLSCHLWNKKYSPSDENRIISKTLMYPTKTFTVSFKYFVWDCNKVW